MTNLEISIDNLSKTADRAIAEIVRLRSDRDKLLKALTRIGEISTEPEVLKTIETTLLELL